MLSEMFDDIRFCPVCTTDWQGKPIPEKDKHLYKGGTHYSRLIGVEIPEKYDGVSYWECPDCHTRWDRFTGEKIAIQKGKGKR